MGKVLYSDEARRLANVNADIREELYAMLRTLRNVANYMAMMRYYGQDVSQSLKYIDKAARECYGLRSGYENIAICVDVVDDEAKRCSAKILGLAEWWYPAVDKALTTLQGQLRIVEEMLGEREDYVYRHHAIRGHGWQYEINQ